MIDWFRGEIPFNHFPLPSGHVVSITPDGEVEWTCQKKIQCRSSWETNLNIKSVSSQPRVENYGDDCSQWRLANNGMFDTLQIDGNLCKFLQGHNVFGSRDLNVLVFLSLKKITEIMSNHFKGHDLQIKAAENLILAGEYPVKMVDINQLYDCGNDLSVEAWLHAAEMRAVCRSGKATRDKGTVYLAKHSKRHAFKFYNKLRELTSGKKHALPNELQGLGLESFVTGKLRAELRLFAKELQERHGITHGKHLDETVIQTLFNDYLGRITMTGQVTLFDEELMKLPRSVYSTYQHWRSGVNCKEILPRPTFYRHRNILLGHGIDILNNNVAEERSNVIPMIRIIEAVPVAIPQWAYDKKLIAM